jgi:hypothetical protein
MSYLRHSLAPIPKPWTFEPLPSGYGGRAPAARRSSIPWSIATAQEVRLTLPSGVTRTARLTGDQGCVTLPRSVDKVFFNQLPCPSGDSFRLRLAPDLAADEVAVTGSVER